MFSNEVKEELAKVSPRIREKVTARVIEILALAESYRYLGNGFTFDRIGDDDDAINRMLIKLSDEVIQDAEKTARTAIGESVDDDDDALLLIASGNNSLQERIDSYSSHLKYILEGWIAIGFAYKVSGSDLLTQIISHFDDPYSHPLWRSAFRQGREFASDIIKMGGYTWGKGSPVNPIKGMTIVSQTFITEAYQEGVREGFRRAGVEYFRVNRGSGFDCAVCDSVCSKVYTIDQAPLPVHPRCMCWMSPATQEDMEKYESDFGGLE